VVLEAVEGLRQLGDKLGIEGVERIRTVEPDQADAAPGFGDDGLVGHGVLPSDRVRPQLTVFPPARPSLLDAVPDRRARRIIIRRRSLSPLLRRFPELACEAWDRTQGASCSAKEARSPASRWEPAAAIHRE